MKALNLIYPETSDILYKLMAFPDGQPHIKIGEEAVRHIDRSETVRIITRIASPADILRALLAKNVLNYMEFERIELSVSYLMGARMDRVMQEGEPFSLKVIAAILNGGGFTKITVFDPHSEVTTALLDKSYAIPNHAFVKDAIDDYLRKNDGGKYCLVSPDAGALKKIHKLAKFLDVDTVVECMKERDARTGALTNFSTATPSLDGMLCFIVDDICDGGGTFAGTAKMLKSKGAGRVVLIVSHGIFSKGIDIPFIDEVYTTDSYRYVEHVNCFMVCNYI